MSNPAVSVNIEGRTAEEERKPGLVDELQSYLVAKYREALKSGDKSFANSCLLSTKLLTTNNPSIVDDGKIMTKDGDVGDAAGYFNRLFEALFAGEELRSDAAADARKMVANQMKEEMRLILTELKSQWLKLKSTPDPTNMRQAPPVSSPRSRMSSEDRSVLMSRDSVQKLDSHLISHKKSCFYQELFDNLPQETRQGLINYSIENCDNPFERCRLMMLSITLSNDCVKFHGPKLFRTLIELSEPASSSDRAAASNTDRVHQRSNRAVNMCQYAKSMLVIDAIPLVFNLSQSQDLDVDIDELFTLTFKYYSEFCLNVAASEFDLEELHENVRKSLASNDPLKTSALEDQMEERINLSLNLIFDKFLREFSNDVEALKKLEKMRQNVVSETSSMDTLAELIDLLHDLGLEVEIPESVLFAPLKEDLATQKQPAPAATPPPKGRGRPKKAQTSVIVSPDDALKRTMIGAARKTTFIFYSYAQIYFMHCSQYLRWTRCMLLVDTRNPLAAAMAAELMKNQRKTRQTASDTASPAKRHKGENSEPDEGVEMGLDLVSSPLSTHGSRLDESYRRLKNEARNFIDKSGLWFDMMGHLGRNSTALKNFLKLWERFNHETAKVGEAKWARRIEADRLLHQGSYREALDILSGFVSREDFIKREDSSDERVLTVPISSSVSSGQTVDVALLRVTAQMIFCHVQLVDVANALNTIADLLTKTKQTGLAMSTEDSLHELSFGRPDMGKAEVFEYPLLTVPSLIHYCIHVLMEILQCFVAHPSASSELVIGHAIVLSQAGWPRYSSVYDRCIDWIRSNKPKSTTPQSMSAATKFTYPDFFYFVQDPNILEDFMALLNDGYTLDIKSAQGTSSALARGQAGASRSSGSAPLRSGKAITTRGVNKSFKEDLKVALVAQMKHSCAIVPFELVVEFIQSPLIPFLLAEAPAIACN